VRENAAAWRVSLSTERRAEIDMILQKRAELVVR
jgi:hypothetical protein